MGDLYGRLLDHLRFFLFVRIIDADEQGVRFTMGKRTALLGPGLHFFCPGIQKIEQTCVTYQEIDCLVQSMETKDGISVTFSANVGFTIADYRTLRLAAQDHEGTLERSARGILGEIVEAHTFTELRSSRKPLAKRALGELKKETEGWGLDLSRCRLTDFVRTRQFRLFNSAT